MPAARVLVLRTREPLADWPPLAFTWRTGGWTCTFAHARGLLSVRRAPVAEYWSIRRGTRVVRARVVRGGNKMPHCSPAGRAAHPPLREPQGVLRVRDPPPPDAPVSRDPTTLADRFAASMSLPAVRKDDLTSLFDALDDEFTRPSSPFGATFPAMDSASEDVWTTFLTH